MPSPSSSSNDSSLGLVAAGAAIAGTVVGMAASYCFFFQRTAEVKDTTIPAKESLPVTGSTATTILRESASAILFPHNHEEKMRRRIEMRAQVEEENSAPRNSVTVRVPATSANMGPGCT
jgi:hypothetical protein